MAHQHVYAERSPWSASVSAPSIVLHPPKQTIAAAVRVPGSKSVTNRALLLAAMATGTSRLTGLLRSDDSYWCIEALRQLGVTIAIEGATVVVTGKGGQWAHTEEPLYMGAAGTIARFLPAVLAAGEGVWTLHGSERLAERPIRPLLDVLSSLGARLTYGAKPDTLPYTLHASGLEGGEVTLPGHASSQFTSGLLLAAPYAKQPIAIRLADDVVQRDYIQMTIDMMAQFGIDVQADEVGQRLTIPTGTYTACHMAIEPDVSTSGYFWAMAAISGGTVRVEGVDTAATKQPDIQLLDALERMGCRVERGATYVEVRGAETLRGGFTLDMHAWSDQTLTMAVLAVYADAPITLTGAAHIRYHECDRISAICTELRKLGVDVQEHEDGLTVRPSEPAAAAVDTYNDHRMAMALSLLSFRLDGIQLHDPGCVSKTCPDYFERLAALGMRIS